MSNISELPVPKSVMARRRILTASLQKAVETPVEAVYGGDSAHGMELRPGQWRRPESVSAEDIASAQRWLRLYEADVAEVEISAACEWLASLVNGVAAGLSERDVELKVRTLAFAVSGRKASLFDGNSLRLAWKRFNFLPTAKELMEFFDGLEADERTEARRLMEIVDAGVQDRPRRADPQSRDFRWSPEAADEQARRNYERAAAERRETLAALGVQPAPVPEQWVGETDREYCARLAERARQQCREAGTAAKRKPREPVA